MHTVTDDWLVWQLVDSAFPTGTFAHSWGLEAAWQQGEIDGPAALRRFVQASIRQTGTSVLPLVNAAHRSPERIADLDALSDAFLLNPVANRASRAQGRTLLATATRIWPGPALTALAARTASLHAHVAPVSGAVFRAIGLPLWVSQRATLFVTARGVLSAAVRLGIAGSYEAQRLQFEAGTWLEETAVQSATLNEDDLAHSAPVLDILQAGHDRLYSRLFQS